MWSNLSKKKINRNKVQSSGLNHITIFVCMCLCLCYTLKWQIDDGLWWKASSRNMCTWNMRCWPWLRQVAFILFRWVIYSPTRRDTTTGEECCVRMKETKESRNDRASEQERLRWQRSIWSSIYYSGLHCFDFTTIITFGRRSIDMRLSQRMIIHPWIFHFIQFISYTTHVMAIANRILRVFCSSKFIFFGLLIYIPFHWFNFRLRAYLFIHLISSFSGWPVTVDSYYFVFCFFIIISAEWNMITSN